MVVGDFAEELETVVIGAGPGGYVAAIRAAQMGQKVTIIERDKIGGVCLNVGCIPSKALINAGHQLQNAKDSSIFGIHTKDVTINFEETQKWKDEDVVDKLTSGIEQLLKKNKVEILKGDAFFTDENTFRLMTDTTSQTYTFKNLILATGSRPATLQGFKYGKRIIDSTGALNLPEIPQKLIVIGGGYIGSELAGAYADLGSQVTIVQRSERILREFDADMVRLVEDSFKKKGVDIVTNVTIKGGVEDDTKATVTYIENDVEKTLDADYILVSTGRVPNTDNMGLESTGIKMNERGIVQIDEQGHTNIPNIYAIGDIVPGPALAHKASYEAKIVAEVIAGKQVKIDYKTIPAVCYTDPELAVAGMTLTEAKEKGMKVKAARFPFAANGRAMTLEKREGFARIVYDEDSQIIIGAQIAGVGASDLIAELVLAIESSATLEDVALTIHTHPTLSEIIMDTAEVGLGLPIHI